MVATKRLVGRVQQAVARSVKLILFEPIAFWFFAFEENERSSNRTEHQRHHK
jgi:hypothetical protein